MNTPSHAVVVGVSADGYGSALGFAVAEARRSGRPLHLVHVVQLPAGEAYVGVYGGMLEHASAVLDEALAKAEDLAGADVSVTAELVDNGWVVEDLVRHADGASLLVMQHRALSRVKRVFTGSMVHSVAGRADVPVVSVPEGWDPAAKPTRTVVTAVQDPVEAPALLRAGFEEASARSAGLVVMHAWWLASGFDTVVVDGSIRDEWAARSHEEMAPVLAPLRTEFPDVHVQVTVRHAPPTEAVLDSAAAADLLVLGRRHHLLPMGSHLGPVARAALDHATCPVLITPELPARVEAAHPARQVTAQQGHLAPSSG